MPYNTLGLASLGEWAHGRTPSRVRRDTVYWATGTPECLTTMCLGGYAAHQAGASFIWRKLEPDWAPTVTECVMASGVTCPVSHAARLALGLTEAEAYELFNMELQRPDLLTMDFLDHLVDRATSGRCNLMDEEVEEWVDNWLLKH